MDKSQIPNPKSQINSKSQFPKFQTKKFWSLGIWSLVIVCNLVLGNWNFNLFAQQSDDLEFTLDVTSETKPLPKIFRPNVDLSGRGFHRDSVWPQGLAAKDVLDVWQQDIGFSGVYRLQYNLWEINQLGKNEEEQAKLSANYENIMQKITEAGGLVILDLFGTPAGLGRVLDKRSAPWDLKAFKELVKNQIRKLSYEKRYNIWYEVWSAPDLDDFFLGRKQDYLNIYRAVSEAIEELESETKVHIPLGGPAPSWWFQNFDLNTTATSEKSLIYELIKFCYRNHLHLDFVTWHAYSSDPKAEREVTTYNKPTGVLIRDWLTYFHFDRNIPLIVTEWNYDASANLLAERAEKSYIAASFIPARLKNMHLAGLDNQIYFSLEDFQNNKEAVTRNLGVFCFDSEASEYKGAPKVIYNVFRMLSLLGKDMFSLQKKSEDEFVGMIATKNKKDIMLLVYNYIDPQIVTNYLSRSIAGINERERRFILNLIKSDKLEKIMRGAIDINTLRATAKVKALLKKAKELDAEAEKFKETIRNIKISVKNLKEDYLYQRYAVDSSCGINCKFLALEEKNISASLVYEDSLKLAPYSVHLVILKPKPAEPKPAGTEPGGQLAVTEK